MKDNKIYTEESIKSLSPREFTRLRPGVYCGSTEYSTQLLKEIFANALDEHNIGHGDLIEVSINTKENSYVITDHGQGFPVNSQREDGTTVLEAAFSIMNTSGKYDEDGVYGASALGLNGIGGKLTNFLSKKFSVCSTAGNGAAEELQFEDGILKKRKTLKVEKGETGTSISFIPDEQFFTHKEVNIDEVKKLFKEISALCPKLTIELNIDNKKEIFHSKNGLEDLIKDKVKGKEIIKTRFITHLEKGDSLLDLCLTYTSNYSDDITAYVNYGLTDSGIHITNLKTNLTRVFNKFANENNLFKKGESNLTGQELGEGLVIVFNLKATGVQYDSQTKTRVTDIDKTLIAEAINKEFSTWLINNKKDAEKIIEKALEARRAREAAKKAREAVRKPKKEKGLKAKMQLSDKLINCSTHNPKENSLLIVEGLSAGSSAVEARDPKRHAIMMLRGKCISVLKATKDKVLANKEYNDIITAIGAGFDETFDLKKMNYDKIVITSDFDSDGQNIELLLITFFFRYMRPLVEAGKLYRAVTPLYVATYKGKDYYLYNEEELENFRKGKGAFDLSHNKGLGELNPEDLKKVCFDNELYKRINISDVKKAEELLEILMGKDVTPRKNYIYENATEIGFSF
jgi:DNA gyrase subunit B